MRKLVKKPAVWLAAGSWLMVGCVAFSQTAKRLQAQNDSATRTPIKHVLVIVGENRTFDNIFATYVPKSGQSIWNLLSRGIINKDGTPGPNFALALQRRAKVTAEDGYQMSPEDKRPYKFLPPPVAGGPTVPYVSSLAQAASVETALPEEYLPLLLTGGTGLKVGEIDTRTPHAKELLPGPFQLTPAVPYDAYAQSPVHRFYQMWQELDCDVSRATAENPSGCLGDLFAWVNTSVGAGSNGTPIPPNFNDQTTQFGGVAMSFYNVEQGDAPYLKSLADEYSMSDNFHQSIQGGTGANHIALGTGDAIWFSDGKGNPLTPPALNIEDPNPQPGTNNYYTQDGYSGGSYSDCADPDQPGVSQITDYLHALNLPTNCEAKHYYLLNNYKPGYFGDGTVNSHNFVIPPSSVRTIGDELNDHHISWRYYGDQWNIYVKDPNGTNPLDNYCDICNPFQYSTSIMTDTVNRTTHMKDMTDFYSDIDRGWLPAFAIVKPSAVVDGHPASSKLNLFEGFTKKVVDAVKGNPNLWKDTVIIVTFDEGGGYYDSGYVQPLDFFGDGTRIPIIMVSPYAKRGYLSHRYSDHVSILKFVERNWNLPPITNRSRDNLPEPVMDPKNPWVPKNGRALDDLFDLFDFSQQQQQQQGA